MGQDLELIRINSKSQKAIPDSKFQFPISTCLSDKPYSVIEVGNWDLEFGFYLITVNCHLEFDLCLKTIPDLERYS